MERPMESSALQSAEHPAYPMKTTALQSVEHPAYPMKTTVRQSAEHPTQREGLGIYIHIPFCARKCAYCDFLSAPADEDTIGRYVNALCHEISSFPETAQESRNVRETAQESRKFPATAQVRSIFLGGGTPSLLSEEQLLRIFKTVRTTFPEIRDDAEITVECNPGTLNARKLEALKCAGVNRLSIGAQSARDTDLRCLGRIHTWAQFVENYEAARQMGFTNINVDLMSALPGQTPKDWRESLQRVAALEPEHISAYSLIIEEGTLFYERYHSAEGRKLLPSEDEDLLMYEDTKRILEDFGMHRYEISNYAKPGYESVHNTGYWERRPYAGFGLGASAFLGGVRSRNTPDLQAYLKACESPGPVRVPKEEQIILSEEDAMEETMFLGLRMMRGVSLTAFEERFHVPLEEIYKTPVRELTGQGLLEKSDGWIRLTDRGIFISNYVFSRFLLDE